MLKQNRHSVFQNYFYYAFIAPKSLKHLASAYIKCVYQASVYIRVRNGAVRRFRVVSPDGQFGSGSGLKSKKCRA